LETQIDAVRTGCYWTTVRPSTRSPWWSTWPRRRRGPCSRHITCLHR